MRQHRCERWTLRPSRRVTCVWLLCPGVCACPHRYSDLQAYLDEHLPNRFINFRENILPRVNRLILDSLLAVKSEMREGTTRRCFELFGYDFMVRAPRWWPGVALGGPSVARRSPCTRACHRPTAHQWCVLCAHACEMPVLSCGQIDEDLRAWLIEVNTNPCVRGAAAASATHSLAADPPPPGSLAPACERAVASAGTWACRTSGTSGCCVTWSTTCCG